MIKQEILSEYKKPEDKMLLAQVLDKIEFVDSKNRIQCTDFLDMYQLNLVQSFLNKNNISNYLFFGGYDNAERKILVLYPEKYNEEMINKNLSNIIKVIRIELPNDLVGKYTHKDYLGGVIKLGIKREKVGDILVSKEGADIIICDEISEFLLQNVGSLTRFSESKITLEDIKNLKEVETKKEELKIIVSSLRLDNIVSELAKCSRNKATQILNTERVFVNCQCETKKTKQIKSGDIITIRGKGRFEVKDFVGNTRSGRYIINVEKFV